MTSKIPSHLRVITHYEQPEPDAVGDPFGGSYYSIEVIDVLTGERLADFGDYYHDKGSVKTAQFIATLEWLRARMGLEPLEIADEDIADGRMVGE